MMTTDFGHTPGPWFTRPMGPWSVESDYASHSAVAIGNDHGVVAIVVTHEYHDDAEFDANISLLAASKCMLKALIGLTPILATAESNASGNPEWEVVSGRINAARAAIAKATGK